MNKRVISVITVALILTIAGIALATGGLDSAERQLKLAYKLLDEGKYEEAILAFQKVIEIDPRKTEAYAGLSLAYAHNGQYDKAIATVNGALAMGLDNPELLHEAMVEIYLQQGDENGARVYLATITDKKTLAYLKQEYADLFEEKAANAIPEPTPGVSGEPAKEIANISSPINEAVIRDLFRKTLNEEELKYNLDDIKWQKGCFTKTDSVEAIVSIYDRNQSHASRWSEIWLLRYESDWVLDRKIADVDSVSFIVVDIEKDGKQEVWVTQTGGGTGRIGTRGELLSFSPGTQSVLYSNEGFENYEEGKKECKKHDIDFQDIDNDGILEIIDEETKEYYSQTGGSGPPEYVKTSSITNKSTYKMENGHFLQIDN
ncbi:MAG: tetratricopeptide repeat protein [Firmicutes bacterium]|nr:tetratricopeptide repeat protein [Bacillota bacterium]